MFIKPPGAVINWCLGVLISMKFFLDGEITEESVNKLIRDVTSCPSKRIIIYINSSGGDFDAAKHFYGFLGATGKDIATAVTGECCSSAVLIAVAGHERWAIPTAKFMIHPVFDTGLDDDVEKLVVGEDVKLGIKEYQKLIDEFQRNILSCQKYTDEYFKIISDNSGISAKKIRAQVEQSHDNDWEFTAKEALRYRLIDNIGLPPDSRPEPVRA